MDKRPFTVVHAVNGSNGPDYMRCIRLFCFLSQWLAGIFVAGQCLSHSFKRTRQKRERDREWRGSEWGGRDGWRDGGREREKHAHPTHTPTRNPTRRPVRPNTFGALGGRERIYELQGAAGTVRCGERKPDVGAIAAAENTTAKSIVFILKEENKKLSRFWGPPTNESVRTHFTQVRDSR